MRGVSRNFRVGAFSHLFEAVLIGREEGLCADIGKNLVLRCNKTLIRACGRFSNLPVFGDAAHLTLLMSYTLVC